MKKIKNANWGGYWNKTHSLTGKRVMEGDKLKKNHELVYPRVECTKKKKGS